MEPATWHIFVFELLMPDWLKFRDPFGRNLRKHLIGTNPLCKQRQLYIYIYIYTHETPACSGISLDLRGAEPLWRPRRPLG